MLALAFRLGSWSKGRCLMIWQLSCDHEENSANLDRTWIINDIIKPLNNYSGLQPDLFLYEIIKCFLFNYICYLQLKTLQHSSLIGRYILNSKLMSITKKGHNP